VFEGTNVIVIINYFYLSGTNIMRHVQSVFENLKTVFSLRQTGLKICFS
jgi:hypothetical protein